MPPRRRPPEGPDNTAANAASSMDRFRALTTALVNVPRAKVAEEQERLSAENALKNNRKSVK